MSFNVDERQKELDREIELMKLEHEINTYRTQLLDWKKRKLEHTKSALVIDAKIEEFSEKMREAQDRLNAV